MFTRPSATTDGTHPILTAEHPAYSQSALLQQGQGAACFQPNSHTPVPGVHGVKRALLVSPSVRAEKYRKSDQPSRVPLKHVGFNPKNRGGQGLIASFLHNPLGPDIIKNGTSINRYAPVLLVEVPQDVLQAWRAANKHKCDTDPLMPMYSAEMWMCCITKSHFTHACKLIQDGNRYVGNGGMLPAMLHDGDTEGRMIQEYGVQAVIYGPELWKDVAALQALIDDDGLDIQLRREKFELEAFLQVGAMIASMETRDTVAFPLTVTQVMRALNDSGVTNNLSASDIRILVSFRLGVATKAAELFRVCVMHMTHGRFSADVKNFSRVAALHPVRWSVPKICILMYLYCQLICDEPASSQALVASSGYLYERVKVKAISKATIFELSDEPTLLDTFTKFCVQMCKHYTGMSLQLTDGSADLLTAQSNMLIACGKGMIKVGTALAKHTAMSANPGGARKHANNSIDREKIIAKVMKDRLSRTEAKLRRDHETAGTFRNTEMPPAKYQRVNHETAGTFT